MSAFLAKGMEFDAVLVVSTRLKTEIADENENLKGQIKGLKYAIKRLTE